MESLQKITNDYDFIICVAFKIGEEMNNNLDKLNL